MTALRTHPSAAKATDAAAVRFRVPDLDAQAAFLDDFGLKTESEDGAVVGRGADGNAAYVAEEGESAFVGLSLFVRDEADLEALSKTDGATQRDGEVRMTDPNGWTVTARLLPNPRPALEPRPRNESGAVGRPGMRLRVRSGPSEVLRLGHVVLRVASFPESLAWYQDRFGFLVSDAVSLDGENEAGAFLRCDKGEALADHHSLFLMQSPDGKPQFEHAAFEVRDIDALMAGSGHLRAKGYQHAWGVGRHVLGAHVFDYWRDPHGFELEHWTDGDLLDASDPPGRYGLPALLGTQWGPPHPMTTGGA